jgi:hypothetical protein
MKWRNFSYRDSQKIITKLSLQPGQSKRSPHPVYWYYLDGKKQLRVTMPNQHGGSGSLSTGFIKSIQDSLKVTTQQFEELVDCPLTAEEYATMIRVLLQA